MAETCLCRAMRRFEAAARLHRESKTLSNAPTQTSRLVDPRVGDTIATSMRSMTRELTRASPTPSIHRDGAQIAVEPRRCQLGGMAAHDVP